MSPSRNWDLFRSAGFGVNVAYIITFGVLLLETALALLVFGNSMLPHIWEGPPRHALVKGLVAGGHVIGVIWMVLISFWVQRQERNLQNVPKADLEEQLRSGERTAMLSRILWGVLALVWLGLAAGLVLLVFA